VAQLRDQLADDRGRRTSGFVLAVLSNVCEHAREREWMRDNPTKGVRKLRRPSDAPKANRPWALDERQVVLAAAKPHERVPLALAMFLGLRLGDVARFPRNAIQSGLARLQTTKTGQSIVVPVHGDLAAILAAAPRHDATTLAASGRGTPWTKSGIQTMLHRLTTRLEAEGALGPGLTFHGLRHTCGTLLAEAGADLDTIRRWLGQATLQMAQHYSEQADRSKQARGVLKKLDVLGTKVSRRRD
jgi:integrase